MSEPIYSITLADIRALSDDGSEAAAARAEPQQEAA